MEGFRGAGWYRKRAVNVGSGAVGAVRGGLVTKVSGMEGGLSMVAGGLGASGGRQWSTGSAGTWSGRVLVFDIPTKGPNIVLSEELARHQTPISDIATEPAQGQECWGNCALVLASTTGHGFSRSFRLRCGAPPSETPRMLVQAAGSYLQEGQGRSL